MTRIVAGVAGGRRLVVPGRDTRPTSDRAREALFSTVESLVGGLAGARVLDLYAGSGALGLEALSRGAAAALFVESAPAALRALRANIAALGLPGATIVADRVERVLVEPAAGPPYDVLLADPPYPLPAGPLLAILARLPELGWLDPDGLAVVERSSRDGTWAWPTGWTAVRARRYGEATLWYGRPAQPAGGHRCSDAPSARARSTR